LTIPALQGERDPALLARGEIQVAGSPFYNFEGGWSGPNKGIGPAPAIFMMYA